MDRTITLTLDDEQMKALQSGKAITIRPSKLGIQKWQPKGGDYCILKDFSVALVNNNCTYPKHMTYQTESQAEQAAKGMLEVAWDGIIPVDPIRIARKLGISVYEHKLDPEVSGAIVKEVGQDPVILLNSNDNVKRQTFTCAHEIGHFVYRADKANQEDVEHFEYVDFRAPLSSAGISEEEVFANSFAANLLMPGNLVREYAIHLLPSSLAVKFGVSIEAITYRLKNLNLLQ